MSIEQLKTAAIALGMREPGCSADILARLRHLGPEGEALRQQFIRAEDAKARGEA